MTVLIDGRGGIQLIANSDWPMERLAAERGATTVYRVRHRNGRIEVEGREAESRCLLEAEKPEAVVKQLLRDSPRYQVTTARLLEGTTQPLQEVWDSDKNQTPTQTRRPWSVWG